MNTTAKRLATALMGYVTLVILLLTLNPFYLALPERIHVSLHASMGDIVANVLLFLPIGFLYQLTGGERRGAFLTGAIISFGIEVVQVFIPARTSSVIDFLCNTLGAGMGAVIYDLLASRIAITRGPVGRLRLEAPLMGLIYLLVPLLWVNALTVSEMPNRWVLTALVGLCGAIIFGEQHRQWSETVSPRITGTMALAAGAWFLVGSVPGFLRPLQLFFPIGFAVALLAAALTAVSRRATDRRFERTTLNRVVPVFAVYLVLAALWHPFQPLGSWHWMFGFTTQFTETSLQAIYPRSEYLLAFMVLGYLSAEWRGRSELPLRQDLPRLLLVSAGCALVLEILAGFQSGSGASLIRALLVIASALFGGTLYHLLRAHIRFLLGRSKTPLHMQG